MLCVLVLSAPAYSKDKWLAIKTRNFNVVSNAGEADARQLALRLEQFRAIFTSIFKIQDDSPVPINVVAFKNDGSFKPFKPLYNGKPANVAGYFQRGDDENFIAINLSASEQRPLAIVLHEYTHLLTSYTDREWPVWLKEGIAELYSTFDMRKTDGTIGYPVERHVLLLREQFLPLERIFRLSHGSPDYNERDKQGLFYAESWALVHYLMLGNERKLQPQFSDFVRQISDGAEPGNAFREIFKMEPAAMEKDLRQYLRSGSYTGLIVKLANIQFEKDWASRELSDAESQFYLGDLLLHTHRVDEAEKLFLEARAMDPKLAGPLEGLGFVAVRRENYSQARQHLKQAIELGSQNHLGHYYYAQAMQRDVMGESGTIGLVAPDMAQQIVAAARESIRLMPGFVPPYNILGVMSLAGSLPPAEGLQAISTALKLEPQNRYLALTLAQLQMRAQDVPSARKTLAPLLSDSDERLRSSAESLLSFLERDSRLSGGREPPRLGSPQRSSNASATEESNAASPVFESGSLRSVRGVLAAIECGNGMVLMVKSEGAMLRFFVSDPIKLEITSTAAVDRDIGCGPIDLPAVIQFRPPAAGNTKFAGDAIHIELVKEK